MFHMRRREFITLLGGAVTAWPLEARAQQERVRLVGVVSGWSEDEMRPLLAALRSRLIQNGWTEGHNLAIDARLGAGDYALMTEATGALVGRNPDVIVVTGTPGLAAVRQHTRIVPVVFTLVADPVRTGMIESLARPGGHATGFTNFEFSTGGKWLELLKDLSPHLTQITIIANPNNPMADPLARYIEAIGRAISIGITTASVRGPMDMEAAIIGDGQQSGGGVIVLPDSLAVVHSDLIIGLAERYKRPAIYPFRTFASKGGLLSYGLDVPEIFRQAAGYVDRILRGARPSDLPVQAPTKYELVINLKTAKALGLEVPPTLLALADEVIE